jgi:hypothetical protein
VQNLRQQNRHGHGARRLAAMPQAMPRTMLAEMLPFHLTPSLRASPRAQQLLKKTAKMATRAGAGGSVLSGTDTRGGSL